MGAAREYVLGSSDHELERLVQQHEVWSEVTTRVLDRLGLAGGERVLDLGCGPGLVLAMLRERVGEAGHVVGVDEAERWVREVEARRDAAGWTNVEVRRARIEERELEQGSVDLVFLRWVLGFLPERAGVLRRLARFLRPGGRIAVMDYNHHGVSLFPGGDGFLAAVRATRALYASRGGNPWVMGEIPRLFREAGLEPLSLDPYVIAGGPGSPAFRWADGFFPYHTEGMVAAGVLAPEERDRFLAEWAAHRTDPSALFYSPIVACAVARRPEDPR